MIQEKKLFSVNGEPCVRMVRLYSAELGDESLLEEGESADATLDEDLTQEQREFSVASLTERLRMNTLNSKMRFRRTVMDYKRFLAAKKSNLELDKLNLLQRMFMADIMAILTDYSEEIIAGKRVSTILGVSSLGSQDLTKAVMKLSIIYPKALKSEKLLGDVPKNQYIKLTQAMELFFSELKKVVFGEPKAVNTVDPVGTMTK